MHGDIHYQICLFNLPSEIIEKPFQHVFLLCPNINFVFFAYPEHDGFNQIGRCLLIISLHFEVFVED